MKCLFKDINKIQIPHKATASPIILFLFLCFLISLETISTQQQQYQHPLDPLTPSEFNLVRTIVLSSYPSSSHTITFHYIGLDEPNKPNVLSWLSSNPKSKTLPRQAFVIARSYKQTLEFTVDLPTRSIISSRVYDGHGYPMLTIEEQTAATQLALTYPPFIQSVRKRRLNVSEVVCAPLTAGWFGEKQSSRMVQVECFYQGGTVNYFMRPISGITMVADIDDMKIVEFEDLFLVQLPKAEGTEYRASQQRSPLGPKLEGVAMKQPEAPRFKIDGHIIRSSTFSFLFSHAA